MSIWDWMAFFAEESFISTVLFCNPSNVIERSIFSLTSLDAVLIPLRCEPNAITRLGLLFVFAWIIVSVKFSTILSAAVFESALTICLWKSIATADAVYTCFKSFKSFSISGCGYGEEIILSSSCCMFLANEESWPWITAKSSGSV